MHIVYRNTDYEILDTLSGIVVIARVQADVYPDDNDVAVAPLAVGTCIGFGSTQRQAYNAAIDSSDKLLDEMKKREQFQVPPHDQNPTQDEKDAD